MPNPRDDINEQQYTSLRARGLSDGQIAALTTGGLSLLLAPPSSPAVGPSSPVAPAPLPAPRGREPDLMATQRAFVSEALGAPRPGEVAERESRARALETVPFTPGGAVAPGMPAVTSAMTSGARAAGEGSVFAEAVRLARGQQESGRPGAELLSGFLPQTIESADTARARQAREFAASRAAFSQMKYLVEGGFRPGLTLDDIVDSAEYAERRSAILAGDLGPELTAALEFVGAPGRAPPSPASMAGAVLGDVGASLSSLATRPLRTGETVEAPTLYALRVLSAPPSAAVGAGEALLTGKSFGQAAGKRIREGEGFVGGGRDLGDAAGELLGLERDAPLRAALRTTGAGVGLVGEFLVPGDLGLSAAARAGARGARAAGVATRAGADTSTAVRMAREALRRPSRRTVNDSLIDLVAESEEVRGGAERLARVLDVDDTAPPPPAEPPSTQGSLFGGPPPARAADVAEEVAEEVDTLTRALRRVGIEEDVDTFVRRLEESNVIPARVGRAVRAALDEGGDTLGALRRAAPAPGTVRRVSGAESPSADEVASVLALQAGARAVRGASLAGPRVRLTPRLVADRDVANALYRGFTSRPSAMLSEALRKDSSYLIPAAPGGEVRVRLGDLVADLDGVDAEDLVPLGLPLRDGADSVPLRVLNEAVLDDFERMALASGKVEEVAPVGGRAMPAEAPALEGAELSSILRPVELRPGRLRASLEARLSPDAFDDIDPVLRPLVDELGRRWGGIDEEFLSLMRAERGVPRPVAFARVLAGAYDSPRQMVGDVLANLFGGFETMGDMVFGASSHRVLLDLRSSPARLRAEVAELLRRDPPPEALAEVVALFERVGSGAEWGEQTLSALMVLCRRLADEGVTLKSLGGTIDTPPLFGVDRLVDLMCASYFQRRTAAIVSEVFTPERLRSSGYLAEYAPAEFVAGLRDQLNATRYGRPLNDRDVVEMLGYALKDEAVYRRAENQQQTWMFADLGPTVPAPIQRLLSDLSDSQQKELYSLVRDRAIEMTQQSPSRGNYNEALKRYIELYADNKVNTPIARLEALGLDKQARSRLARLASPESFKKMMQRIKADEPGNNRLLRRLGDAFGNVGAGLERWAKGGLLAGRLLPNLVYQGVNWITAPSIVYSTMGLAAGARAAARSVGLSLGAATPLRVFFGQTELGVQIVARSPTGQVYTAGDVARLIPQIATQTGAELSDDVLRSLVAWSGLSARRAADPSARTIRAMGQGRARRVLREWTGLDLTGTLDGGASVQVNVFNQAANASDLYFRVGTLVDALEAGRSVDEAVRIANDALFDYGRVSDVERNIISRVIWFWSFRRESLRTTLINVLESPERIRASYQSLGVFSDDEEYTVATKDYLALRPFLAMVQDPETRKRVGIYGPSIPLLQSAAELVDYLSAGVLVLDGVMYTALGYDASPELFRPGADVAGPGRRAFEASTVLTERALQYGLSETATPWVTLVSEVGLGIQRDEKGRPIGDYLDPRLLAYMRLNPDAEATFLGLVNVERVPIEEEYPGGGRYLGRQWRVADDSISRRNYAALRHAMLFAGFDRTLRDYAPAYHAAVTSGQDDLPIQLRPGFVDNEALDTFFRSIGAATPANLPTVEDRERGNLRTLEYIIKDAQR